MTTPNNCRTHRQRAVLQSTAIVASPKQLVKSRGQARRAFRWGSCALTTHRTLLTLRVSSSGFATGEGGHKTSGARRRSDITHVYILKEHSDLLQRTPTRLSLSLLPSTPIAARPRASLSLSPAPLSPSPRTPTAAPPTQTQWLVTPLPRCACSASSPLRLVSFRRHVCLQGSELARFVAAKSEAREDARSKKRECKNAVVSPSTNPTPPPTHLPTHPL